MKKRFCRICGKDMSKLKTRGYKCSACYVKEIYFGGLYYKTLERDKYKCSECGKVGFNLRKHPQINIHHIDNNPKNNILNNLQTLCTACHNKKRVFDCLDCKKEFIATSPSQKRCIVCNKKRLAFIRGQANRRFWKKLGSNNYKKFDELSYQDYISL